MVFTGGGSLLRNVDRLGEDVLGLPVRIGEPCEMISPDAVQSPAHATGVGLLRFASDNASEQLTPTLQPAGGGGSRPRLVDRVARLFSFL